MEREARKSIGAEYLHIVHILRHGINAYGEHTELPRCQASQPSTTYDMVGEYLYPTYSCPLPGAVLAKYLPTSSQPGGSVATKTIQHARLHT